MTLRSAVIGSTVLAVWAVISASAWASTALGRGAMVLGFGAALALVWGVRSLVRPTRRPQDPSLLAGAIGALFGHWLAPVLVGIVGVAGLALDLEASVAPSPTWADWIVLLALAPVLEEVLYRELVLEALAGAVGWPAGVLVSSAVFALPHLEPWGVLASGAAGLALGATYAWTRSLSLCVGMHAGLNLGALLA